MANANLFFKFTETATKAGKTGLTVTANVRRITKASAVVSTVATGAACSEVGNGIYVYNLASPDFATYDYAATAVPSVTTGLDAADCDALQADFSADSLKPTVAGRTLDVSAGGEAGVDWANVGSPTTTINLSGTTVKTATDVETDTQNIQSRIPDALEGGAIKAYALSIGAVLYDEIVPALWGHSDRALTDKAGFAISGTLTTLDALNASLVLALPDEPANSTIASIWTEMQKVPRSGTSYTHTNTSTDETATVAITPA